MEPLSAIELTLAINEVVQGLYRYITAVKDAKDDIRRLTQELFALRAALEHFEYQKDKDPSDAALVGSGAEPDLDNNVEVQVQAMLRLTRETLDSIQQVLKRPSSKVGRAVHRLTWPFHQNDVETFLKSIERAKTWFIMVAMRDSSDITCKVYEEVKMLASVVHSDIIARREGEMMKETEELLKWLAPYDSEEELIQVRKVRTKGTGQWIWDDRFRQWEGADKVVRPFFWIAGKSGSGKTVLFSSIVDELKTRCSVSSTSKWCGVHCCSLDDAASQKPNNIFGSMLVQAANRRPELMEHLQPLHPVGTHVGIAENSLKMEQIHDLMDKVVALFDVFYVLIDALNETPDGYDELVSALVAMCNRHRNIRVLVTCTRDPDNDYSALIQRRDMSAWSVDSDIRAYVDQRLSSEPPFRRLSERVKVEIREKITGGANGMFRWAKLSMDRLAMLRTGTDMRSALTDLPATLNEAYVRILLRTRETDRPLAREALLWLCFSLRPLLLEELADAMVMRLESASLDEDDRLPNPSDVFEICQGLAHSFREKRLTYVTLAHDSIRSFLTSDWIKSSPAAEFYLDRPECHRIIMRKCLTYLSFDAFASGPVGTHPQLKARSLRYPLLPYAAKYWPIHSERFALSPDDETLILDFFATKKRLDGGSFTSWVHFLLEYTDLDAARNTEPLYYAASYNMIPILRLLLRPELDIDLDARGGRFSSTPLFVAMWRKNIEAAKMLIEAGADVNCPDGVGDTPFELARRWNLTSLVELMKSKKG